MPRVPFLVGGVPVFIPQIYCQIATPWSRGIRIELRGDLHETLQDQIRRWKCVCVAQGPERHVFGTPCSNPLHRLSNPSEIIQILSRFKLNGPVSDTRRELPNRAPFLTRDRQSL